MAEEQTLVLVKPDGVANGHIGDVITRIEHRGFTIDALKVTHATADQLHQHYAALVGEPFFPRIERFMTGGPM
ncbi:nucleoside-diphosphate kinase, partial [Lacticaseibacillus paracasei]